MATNRFFLLLPLLHLLLSITHLPQPVASQTTNGTRVTLGSSLTAGGSNDRWLSPSGDFAFGFFKPSSGYGNRFLVAIWYNKISQKTAVWSANRDSPVEEGSRLELTRNGIRLLRRRDGRESWPANATGAAEYGEMLDNGNFVLGRRNSSSDYLWQSFDHPTDTILPSQVLKAKNKDVDLLTSQLSETNFSRGRFSLRLQVGGNLSFFIKDEEKYRRYGFTDNENFGNANRVVFNETGAVWVMNNQSERTRELIIRDQEYPTRNYYHRVIIEHDGVLRKYVFPKNDINGGSWLMRQHTPKDICGRLYRIRHTPCGYNSICKVNDSRSYCECIPGYSYINPNDKRAGCTSYARHGCKVPFKMVNLQRIGWPKDYRHFEIRNTTDKEECRQWCVNDCFCGVVVLDQNKCRKGIPPLTSGRMFGEKTPSQVFVKVWTNESMDNKGTHYLPIALLSIFLLIAIFFVVFLLYRSQCTSRIMNYGKEYPSNLHQFTYETLQVLTDGFTEELGRGTFGTVYKGKMRTNSQGEKNFIAVKRLDRLQMIDGDEEFKTEVNVIGQTHHKNLVKLVGYCNQGVHRLLVYEFMSKGCLSDYLYKQTTKLCWFQRVKIANAIARGLLYLHEECSSPIIHCDIKPQNILLDDNLNVKISDFGLAKLLKTDQSRTYPGIRGTRGYIAPEWFKNIGVTTKVDVYSFGVMLLEIITCRRSLEPTLEEKGEAILVDWAYQCYEEGRMSELLTESDERDVEIVKQLENMVMVAIWCIQEDASLRPSTRKVTLMLEEEVEVPHPPSTFYSSVVVNND